MAALSGCSLAHIPRALAREELALPKERSGLCPSSWEVTCESLSFRAGPGHSRKTGHEVRGLGFVTREISQALRRRRETTFDYMDSNSSFSESSAPTRVSLLGWKLRVLPHITQDGRHPQGLGMSVFRAIPAQFSLSLPLPCSNLHPSATRKLQRLSIVLSCVL